MTHSIDTRSLQEQSNEIDNKASGEELVKVEQIEGTPFITVVREGKGFIAIGQRRLTDELEPYELEHKAKTIAETDWEFMVSVIGAVVEQCVEVKWDENRLKQKGGIKNGNEEGASQEGSKA